MDKELIEKIEKALGYKLYIATIRYLEEDGEYMWSGRCCGKTMAHILKLVLQKGKVIQKRELRLGMYCDEFHGRRYPDWFSKQFMKVRQLLKAEGIEVVKIV